MGTFDRLMKAETVIFFLLVLAGASAEGVFLQPTSAKGRYGLFAELKEVDGTEFGAKLMDTIALQFKNQSPLADISKLLNDIHAELVTQQKNADVQSEVTERECQKGIAEYNSRVSAATAGIQEAITSTATLNKKIDSLNLDVANKEDQLKILAQKDQELRDARRRDTEDYANRVQQSRAVIGALEQIVPELEHLKPHGNTQTALAELAKIGGDNPIAAFIQVAATLDPGVLQRVIQRLDKIKESLFAAIDEDTKAEAEAKRNFDKLLGEMENVRTNIENALAAARSELEEAKQTMVNVKRTLRENQQELELSSNGKAQLIQQCDEKRSRYRSEKASREAQINTVEKVQHIIASKLDTMRSYVQTRQRP